MVFIADTGHNRIVGIRIKEAPQDRSAPRALVQSPPSGSTVMGAVEVIGIAADAHFAEYRLEAGAGAMPEHYDTIATSTAPVWGGSLGTWPTARLASGPYTLRLTVIDKSGNESVATRVVTVLVDESALIVSASALPASFMADRAGIQIAYELAAPANVTVAILPQGSNHPVWIAEASASGYGGMAGANTMAWDGRDDRAQPVVPGTYFALLTAKKGMVVDRRILAILALLSPEAQVAALAGSRGMSGPLVAPNGTPSGGGAGASTAVGSQGQGPADTGAAGSVGGPSAGTSHDNGWHEGNNPNGFAVDHPDNSQGQGNNHH